MPLPALTPKDLPEVTRHTYVARSRLSDLTSVPGMNPIVEKIFSAGVEYSCEQ
jgi:hypothetical protein